MLNFFEKVNIRKLLKYLLFMFLSLICQNTIFTQLRLFGICPLLLPAVAVAVGMFEGPVFGAYFSLIMGIFGDMAFKEQDILFTTVLPCLSFAAAFMSQYFINRRLFAYMGLALAASVITASEPVHDKYGYNPIPVVNACGSAGIFPTGQMDKAIASLPSHAERISP